MENTKEQRQIIETSLAPGESLFVNAYAGTGKTTTLVEFIRLRPKQKFLYLCFNNKGYQVAEAKFRKLGLRNAKASTIHGLARDFKSQMEAANKFSSRIHLKTIQDKLGCTMPTAWWVTCTLKAFCESGDTAITLENVPYCGGNANVKQIISDSTKKIWKAMCDQTDSFPVSFDGYLKMYQLSNPRLYFDYILVDESQDSNPVSLAVIKQQAKASRLILIGDESQKIYTWRSAVNAFLAWEPTYSLDLTESFRFGDNIAKLASLILQHFQGRTLPLKGHKTFDSIGMIPPSCKYTFIARTNASLYEKAIEYSRKGKKIHFIGTTADNNWDPSIHYKFNDARDVYHLFACLKDKVRNPFFKNFTNYEEFQAVATGKMEGENQTGDLIQGDAEMAALARLVDKYKDDLPNILETITKACSSEGEAEIVLGTAHRAKGLEWDVVKLADDFVDLVIEPEEKPKKPQPEEEEDKDKDKDTEKVKPQARLAIPDTDEPADEYNLLYVAATRAKKHLEPCYQLRKFYCAKELHANPGFWDVEEKTYIPTDKDVPTKAEDIPLDNRLFLNVPFSRKDEAKAMAKRAGGKISWVGDKKKWEWIGPTPLPAHMKEFKL